MLPTWERVKFQTCLIQCPVSAPYGFSTLTGLGLRTQPLGGLGSLGQGPTGGKAGNNKKARASPPLNTTLYKEPESLKTPWARPPSCQAPAALGPPLALAHAEPRPGAVPGHSRCPVGSRMWAGGEQAVGRPHHVHPSSCAKSRARPGPSSPAWPRLLGPLHGTDLPASQAGDSKVRVPCYPPSPVLPPASDLSGPPDPQCGGASCPFAILKTFEGN